MMMHRTRLLPVVLSLLLCQAVFAQATVIPEESLNSVFVTGVTAPDGSFVEVGTAWTIAPNRLATNAHVVERLRELSAEVGGRITARRGLFDRAEIVIGTMEVHPAYEAWNARLGRMLVRSAQQLRNFEFMPVADVAIMHVTAGDAGSPLPIADMRDAANAPALGADVMYLGYPMENLAGFATILAVRGHITARTDFFFQRSGWPEAHLIHFSGPATGGASGSPLLNMQGRVIGVLSAGAHVGLSESERVSFGFTYAQRVDLALEMLDGSVTANQAERNRRWTNRLGELFITPRDLIDQVLRANLLAVRMEDPAVEIITEREETLALNSDELRLRVVVEPDTRAAFIAVAHDGTDIDAQVVTADGSVLGEDFAFDHYPLVVIDAAPSEQELFFKVIPGEPLIQDVRVFMRVVRLPDVEPTPDEGAVLLQTAFRVERAGPGRHSWSFTLDPDRFYVFRATCRQRRDIDLHLLQNGRVIDQDVLIDHFPVVSASGVGGEVVLRLTLPDDAREGDIIDIDVRAVSGGEGEFGFDEETIFDEVFLAPRAGAHRHEFTFHLEAAFGYEFIASCRNDRDIDLRLFQGDRLLDEDVLPDSYPIVEAEGIDGEVRLILIFPSDTRTGDEIEITVSRWPAGEDDVDLDPMFELMYVAERNGAHRVDFPFTLAPTKRYLFVAESDDELDIDLQVFQGDRLLGEDVLPDSIPIVAIQGIAGDVRLVLIFPAGTQSGQKAHIVVLESDAPIE